MMPRDSEEWCVFIGVCFLALALVWYGWVSTESMYRAAEAQYQQDIEARR